MLKKYFYFLLVLSFTLNAAEKINSRLVSNEKKSNESSLLSEYSEEDIERILVAKATNNSIVEGDFYLFYGFSEDMNLICEPLSGVKKKLEIKPNLLEKTQYYKDTPMFEIAQDSIYIFAMPDYYSNPEMFKRFQNNANLLKIFGAQESILLAIKQQKLITTFDKKYIEKRNELRKFRQKNNYDADDFRDIEIAVREELIKDLQWILSLTDEAITKYDVLLAIAIYENTRNNLNAYRLYTSRDAMFKEDIEVINKMLKAVEESLINATRERFVTQLFTKDFVGLFPDAIGLWSESPPADYEQVQAAFLRVRNSAQAINNFSSVTQFEDWGNLRLTLLLFVQDLPEAEYQKDQFRSAMDKYKMRFRN